MSMELIETTAAAGDGFNVALGIGVCTAPAFAIGVTAVPNPFDEIDWDGWLWHWMGTLFSPTGTIGEDSKRLIEIDSKAMRKFDDQDVVYALAQVGEVGTSVMDISLMTRMLISDQGLGR